MLCLMLRSRSAGDRGLGRACRTSSVKKLLLRLPGDGATAAAPPENAFVFAPKDEENTASSTDCGANSTGSRVDLTLVA